jgi:hypothetical protein
MRDADGQPPPIREQGRGSTPLRRNQITSGFQKAFTCRRESHMPGGPFQQPLTDPGLQALYTQADRGLRRVHGLGGAREGSEFGDEDKGLNRVWIEKLHGSYITDRYH